MEASLYMIRDGVEPRGFKLSKPITTIGRREDSDLRIALGEISRKHCKLSLENGSISVEDLGSSNGTYVNGRRVQTMDLEPGDTLQIGPVVFVLQVNGDPDPDHMHPIIASTVNEDGMEISPDAPSVINEIDSTTRR